jgi:iron complex transport system ATP-binding protein
LIVAKPVLQISNLRIQRGNTIILDDICWRIGRGEHWAILGANGSGKTSLLSALAGYLNFTSGEIEVLGEKFGETDWRELRKKIGLVSSSIRQLMSDYEPALLTVLSGKEALIDVWGNGSSKDRTRARKILKQVECGYLSERPWLVLSQGERQRVLIGRALMAKPKLLILDEPCAGLDPVARENLLQFLQRLGSRKDSPTLVLVTHHIEEIMPIFSHALILKSGRVSGCGEKNSVVTSALLSRAFGAKVRVSKKQNRFEARIRSGSRNVV